MQDFKVKLSHILSEKAKELYPEHEISGDDILSMLEYPPDILRWATLRFLASSSAAL